MKNIFALIAILLFSFCKMFAQEKASIAPEVIYYTSDTLKLKGYLYKPAGKGPFPVYMWNHDSERDPDYDTKLAYFWTKKGFIFFKPIRSGHSDNPGRYILNEEKIINRRRGTAQLQFRETYALHNEYNKDVIAALQWIKQQPYADSTKIVVAGAGYGGIQALLTAEMDAQLSLGVKCFIAMAPAAEVWSKMWGDSLVAGIAIAKKPILLIQAQNDFSLGPCETLAPFLEKKGQPNAAKILPAHGDPKDHNKGHTEFFNDPNAWGKTVLKYLKDCGVKGMKH